MNLKKRLKKVSIIPVAICLPYQLVCLELREFGFSPKKSENTLSESLYFPKLGPRKAALFTGQIVRAQEEIGTGGAGFRFMYAAFLQEASVILNNPELKNLSKRMTEIGDNWREFAVITARIVKNRNKADESYDRAADQLLKVADMEEKFYKDLKQSIK